MNTFPRMHVSLYVKDIERTVNFYSTFFGQEPTKVKDDYAKYTLENPSLVISFVQNEERVKSNFGHLGFQVETEEELASRLMTAKNNMMEILEEIGTNCCYAQQDKFWVADPDGHQWEVYYFHKDSEFNDPKYSSEDNSACCTAPVDKQKLSLKDLQNESCCEPGSGCC